MFREDRLKELRKEKGLKQQELADEINVSKSAIGMYELGKRLPPSDVLEKLADFFGVTSDYLLGRTNQKYFLHDETIAFHAEGEMSEEDQKMVRDLIDRLVEAHKNDKK